MTTKNNIPTDAINYMVEYFEATGTLPTNYIECTVTGNAVTCFGTNLKKKIEQYGDIKTLLTTFVSKGAVKKVAKKAVETQTDKVKSQIEDIKKSIKKGAKIVEVTSEGVEAVA
jgi:hypothetical protein